MFILALASSCPLTATMVFPDDDGPKSFVRSTLMVRKWPSTFISTFFMTQAPRDLNRPQLNTPGAGVNKIPCNPRIDKICLGGIIAARVYFLPHFDAHHSKVDKGWS
jgi:hypothetical protein